MLSPSYFRRSNSLIGIETGAFPVNSMDNLS
jgi:hypothetical protein